MSGRTRKLETRLKEPRYVLMPSRFSAMSHGAITFVPFPRYPNLASFTRDGDNVDTKPVVTTSGRWKFWLLHVPGKPATVSSETTVSLVNPKLTLCRELKL